MSGGWQDFKHTMKTSKFMYYMHDGPRAFSFELAGPVSAHDAKELEQAWRTASSVIGDRVLVVDLSFVTQIDDAGRDLMRRWHHNGAALVANSASSRLLAESIIGTPLPVAKPAPAQTYEPFFMQLTRRAAMLAAVIFVTLLRPVPVAADAVPGYWQGAEAPTAMVRHMSIRGTKSPLISPLFERQIFGA